MLKTSSQKSVALSSDLKVFVEHARSKGMSYETIWRLLISGGWKEKEIAQVIANDGLGLPIPEVRQQGGAREAFFHLSAFTCLYVAAFSLVMMLFNLIDIALPDSTNDYWSTGWAYSAVRSSLSAIIVFGPLYVVLNRLIQRATQSGVIVSGATVERWLTYLTLFAIVIAILIDASVLIFMLLEGQMTVRVVLKAITLLAVAGGAFVYLWIGTHRWSERSGGKVVQQE